jgi:hypothetical protein
MAFYNYMLVEQNNNNIINSFAETASLNGSIARFSRAIMETHCLKTFSKHVRNLLSESDTSGLLRFRLPNEQSKHVVNKGVKRRLLSQLQELITTQDKIARTTDLLQFNTQYTYLVIDIEDKADYQQDLLVDNLALLVDTIDLWLQNFIDTQDKFEALKADNQKHAVQIEQSITLIDQSNQNLSQSYQTLIHDILCRLTSQFPTMALEHDQEEMILKLVESECLKHRTVIDAQKQQNEEVKQLLQSAIEQLNQSFENQVKEHTTAQQSVELF